MAEEAAQEQAAAEQRHDHLNRFGEGRIVDRVAEAAHCDGQESHHQPPRIETPAMEGQREGEQV